MFEQHPPRTIGKHSRYCPSVSIVSSTVEATVDSDTNHTFHRAKRQNGHSAHVLQPF